MGHFRPQNMPYPAIMVAYERCSTFPNGSVRCSLLWFFRLIIHVLAAVCASLQVCWLDLDYLKVAQAAVQVSLSVLTWLL